MLTNAAPKRFDDVKLDEALKVAAAPSARAVAIDKPKTPKTIPKTFPYHKSENTIPKMDQHGGFLGLPRNRLSWQLPDPNPGIEP